MLTLTRENGYLSIFVTVAYVWSMVWMLRGIKRIAVELEAPSGDCPR